MGNIKRFNGSSWVDAVVKKFNGSSWVDAIVNKYDGSKWVNMTTQKYTKTWDCTWTQTYRQAGTKRTDYRSEKICQGRYVYEPWGIMRSLVGFGDIQSELRGSKIEKVEIYLRNEHWYYGAGGKAKIGYHNHSSKPDRFSHSKYDAKTVEYSARGQGKWITLPDSFAEGIRDGKYHGFSLFADSGNMDYYGVFYGENDGDRKPKIKITYTK